MENVTIASEKENKKIDRSQFKEAAYLLRALANETRLCVIMQLSQAAELSVTELMEGMNCEQSLLSHHLNDMRLRVFFHADGLVKQFYALKDKRIINVLRCMMHCGEADYATAITSN